jgi:threonine-phosphate decarboxylase
MLDDNLIDFTDHYNSVVSNNSLQCSDLQINQESFYNLLCQKYKLDDLGFYLFHNEELAILNLLSYSKRDYITLYTPTPHFYHNLCHKSNMTIDTIDSIDNFDRDVKRDSIVIFTNPSLASGKYYDIEYHLEAWHKKNAMVILIETSIEYTNKESYIKMIQKYSNL